MALITTLSLGLVLWLGGVTWQAPDAFAQDPEATEISTPANAAVYRFTLGDFKAMVINDGTLTFPVSFFVPNADPAAASAALENHFLATDNLSAYVNALYLETDDHRVLVDTGAGNTFGPTVGYLVQNLEAAGISADSIDTILLTHAHADHIGGLLNDAGELAFKNAEYYISEPEWDFWQAPTVTMPNSLLDQETQATLVGVAKERLTAIADRTTRFALGAEIVPGITAVPSVGHTPGQVSYLITSGEDSLLATGDVFFSDPLNLEHPNWEVVFDTDPKQGIETRKQLLEAIADSRRLVMVPHMPFPGLGHVGSQGEAYGWEPILWEFMYGN
ncbi:MBL fold metallo-hydrolase [filamentous cyanobacterium CCP5]|nr:MBL fold metallo-hydrolase [filamentous cyanobacterium CCP5]